MAATIIQMRGQLAGKRAILFVDNEPACAALMKGTAKHKGALLLVYAFWAIAARRDVGLWTERAPTEVGPPDPPPRDRDLPLEAGLAKEVVPLKDIVSIYDFSWMALRGFERARCELKRNLPHFPLQVEQQWIGVDTNRATSFFGIPLVGFFSA